MIPMQRYRMLPDINGTNYPATPTFPCVVALHPADYAIGRGPELRIQLPLFIVGNEGRRYPIIPQRVCIGGYSPTNQQEDNESLDLREAM